MNDQELEARLRAMYRAEVSQTGPVPLSLQRDVAAIPRPATTRSRPFGRARGMTLLAAAAAVFLVGGALAVGSGVLRLRSNVPPAPSLGPLAIASLDASPSPSELAQPSASPSPVAGPGYWIRTGSMVTPRNGVAVRLADGRVLVAGGYGIDGGPAGTLAELYDPATGTWSATGGMLDAESDFAILLTDGRVLARDELYDPATGNWSATGKPAVYGGSSTLLADGRVLLTGFPSQLYDPANGTWTATGKMVTPRYGQTATLLPNGSVLVAGGRSVPADRPIKSAELYDPKTNSWTATTDMPGRGGGMLATLLRDGTVLVVSRGLAAVAAVYDPATGTWTAAGNPPAETYFTTATPLPDGTVLIAGTRDGSLGDSAIYDPAIRSWAKASMVGSGTSQATLLLDGTVLATGSSGAQLYIPAGAAPPDLAPVPSPTPTPIPTPAPTLYPPWPGPSHMARGPGRSRSSTSGPFPRRSSWPNGATTGWAGCAAR